MAAIGTATTAALAALATMPANDRRQVAALVRATLEALGAAELLATLRIKWNSRFTARMGDALFSKVGPCRLRFSSVLWPRASEGERRETVIHECAHLVDGLRNGRPCGHGAPWKRIMIEAGFSPDRTHSVDRAGLRRTVAAHCACKAWELGAGRAARLRNGTAEYRCRNCGQLLELGPMPRTEAEELEHLLGLEREARKAALEEAARKVLRPAAQAPRKDPAPSVELTRDRNGQAGWRW